jgi:hypothetical protein
LLGAAQRERVTLDGDGLSYALRHAIQRMMERFYAEPTEVANLERLEAAVDLARSLPFEVNLWKVQNRYYHMLQQVRPDFLGSDEQARVWLAHFDSLGDKLGIIVAEPQPAPPSETPAPAVV